VKYISFSWDGNEYRADITRPIEIAISLKNGVENQPNAYGAPLYEATPVRSGMFVGSLDAGAPVNFFNLALNPHGNGTHTECVGHILQGPYTMESCPERTLVVAELVSVEPEPGNNGACISWELLEQQIYYTAEALIVRTLPNPVEKQWRKYTGTHPPYFMPEAMRRLADLGYQHFLTDLPSVDPEVDDGALAAHKAFWDTEGSVRSRCTITEMVYVAENVPDGLYLLDLHTVAIDLDVSPSRPVLYRIEKVT